MTPRYHNHGRNSWTAPTGYQHGSRFGGAFRSTRDQFRWLVSANPGWPHLMWATPSVVAILWALWTVMP